MKRTQKRSSYLAPLRRAIELAQGVTATAAALGVEQCTVSQWIRRKRVSVAHAIPLAELVGQRVTHRELRPDIYGKA